ncbi:MAG: DUF2007 domain-containing protein [Archangiaceae bacterium]|nr:DUF2007 domain-containing protein [Archangiaceae bacterium]
MTAQTHETVLSTTDRLEAQSVVSMLASHGIEARLSGVVDSARLGIGDTALPLNVEVPVESVARAKELLAAEPEPAEEAADVRPNRKRPIIAIGVPLVWPGLAHVYAGRPWTGAVLALALLLSLPSSRTVNAAGVYLLLVLADAVFGVRGVHAFNRGQHRPAFAQLAVGVGLSLAALVLSSGTAGVRWVRHQLAAREFAAYRLSCSNRNLVIVNEGAEPKDLELKFVSVVATYGIFDEESVSANVPETRLHIVPGARAEVPLTVDPTFACAPEPPGLVLEPRFDLRRPSSCTTRLFLVSAGHEARVDCAHDEPLQPMQVERSNP